MDISSETVTCNPDGFTHSIHNDKSIMISSETETLDPITIFETGVNIQRELQKEQAGKGLVSDQVNDKTEIKFAAKEHGVPKDISALDGKRNQDDEGHDCSSVSENDSDTGSSSESEGEGEHQANDSFSKSKERTIVREQQKDSISSSSSDSEFEEAEISIAKCKEKTEVSDFSSSDETEEQQGMKTEEMTGKTPQNVNESHDIGSCSSSESDEEIKNGMKDVTTGSRGVKNKSDSLSGKSVEESNSSDDECAESNVDKNKVCKLSGEKANTGTIVVEDEESGEISDSDSESSKVEYNDEAKDCISKKQKDSAEDERNMSKNYTIKVKKVTSMTEVRSNESSDKDEECLHKSKREDTQAKEVISESEESSSESSEDERSISKGVKTMAKEVKNKDSSSESSDEEEESINTSRREHTQAKGSESESSDEGEVSNDDDRNQPDEEVTEVGEKKCKESVTKKPENKEESQEDGECDDTISEELFDLTAALAMDEGTQSSLLGPNPISTYPASKKQRRSSGKGKTKKPVTAEERPVKQKKKANKGKASNNEKLGDANKVRGDIEEAGAHEEGEITSDSDKEEEGSSIVERRKEKSTTKKEESTKGRQTGDLRNKLKRKQDKESRRNERTPKKKPRRACSTDRDMSVGYESRHSSSSLRTHGRDHHCDRKDKTPSSSVKKHRQDSASNVSTRRGDRVERDWSPRRRLVDRMDSRDGERGKRDVAPFSRPVNKPRYTSPPHSARKGVKGRDIEDRAKRNQHGALTGMNIDRLDRKPISVKSKDRSPNSERLVGTEETEGRKASSSIKDSGNKSKGTSTNRLHSSGKNRAPLSPVHKSRDRSPLRDTTICSARKRVKWGQDSPDRAVHSKHGGMKDTQGDKVRTKAAKDKRGDLERPVDAGKTKTKTKDKNNRKSQKNSSKKSNNLKDNRANRSKPGEDSWEGRKRAQCSSSPNRGSPSTKNRRR